MTTKKQLSEEIVEFLVSAGLLSSTADPVVSHLPGRRRAACVRLGGGNSLFVKKYELPSSLGDFWLDVSEVGEIAASFCGRPETLFNREGWFANHYIDNGGTLKNLPLAQFTPELARAVGRSLGSFHESSVKLLSGLGDAPGRGVDPQQTIQPMQALSPASYADMPGLDRDIFIAASQACREGLIELAGGLKTICAVHGDFQAGNILIQNNGIDVVCFVDWENAGLGDPVWDLGHLFATLLRRWLHTINAGSGSIDGVLLQQKAGWLRLSDWWDHFFKAYDREMSTDCGLEIDRQQLSRVGGHALMQQCKNILYTRGQFTAREVLQLTMARQLIAEPCRSIELLLPSMASGDS